MVEDGVKGWGLAPFSAGGNPPLSPSPDLNFGFVLVGKGNYGVLNSRLNIKCGDVAPIFICTEDYKTHGKKYICKEKLCPNCSEKWILATATKLTNELWALYLKFKRVEWSFNGKTYYGFRLSHIAISYSPDDIFEYIDPITGEFNKNQFVRDGLEYLKSKLAIDEIVETHLLEDDLFNITLLIFYRKSNKIYAGIVIFHPFRANERYYAERREEREEEDENPAKELKKWEWIKSKPNWYDYVVFSPHLHYVGLVTWLLQPEKGEKWIYKFIGEIKTKDDLFAVIYYLLTHTGARQKGEWAYSRIGLFSPKYFDKNQLYKEVRTYFKQFGISTSDIRKMKFTELKKCIINNPKLGKYKKEYLITCLKQYKYHLKCVFKKRKAYRCKLCGSFLTGVLEGLRAYFRAFTRTASFVDPFRIWSFEELKQMVLKDKSLTNEQRSNLIEALEILSGDRPPPFDIPVVD